MKIALNMKISPKASDPILVSQECADITCCRLDCTRVATYRIITLGYGLNSCRTLEPQISESVSCRRCLADFLNDFDEGPDEISETETAESSLVRDIAMTVVPLNLSKTYTETLVKELLRSAESVNARFK